MLKQLIQKWFLKRKGPDHSSQDKAYIENNGFTYEFSPMTYQNPCISYMYPIIEYVLEQKHILYRHLELVVVDTEMEQDDADIQTVLSQVTPKLNYLLLISDRPFYYEDFVSTMFQENGLIVQCISKSARKQAHGNLILDFERSSGVSAESMICPKAVYLPIYKKPWEISENLDIRVPVGYNTLVVDGMQMPQFQEYSAINGGLAEEKIDRLDQEFRKG